MCYHVTPGWKNKYTRHNITDTVCNNCDVPNGERDNIYILPDTSPKIQAQYVSPTSSRVTTTDLMEPLITLIDNLLNNDGTSLDDFQYVAEYEEFLYLHLTHLRTKNHDISSSNVPLGQEKFGRFLSVDAVLRILNINDNGWFGDEIFTLFRTF